ncbi:MAG: methanobactin [Acidobacteria bacterium]|nr:methanobactin [Acidobacteriota bacterium]
MSTYRSCNSIWRLAISTLLRRNLNVPGRNGAICGSATS